MKDPSPDDWDRVQRYASWMHRVHLEEWTSLGKEAFGKLRINSPPGGWFPSLQNLSWRITETNIPYIDLFFSPSLKDFFFHPAWSWGHFGIPPNVPPTLAKAVLALPTSGLERISGGTGHPWRYFKDALSSVVLRCGPSFTEYDSRNPLSDAAITHLIQLPLLHTLCMYNPPPDYTTTSLPPVFPPLKKLTLGDSAAREWLLLFGRLEGGAPTAQGATRLSKTKESLEVLYIRDMFDTMIDSSFISPIQHFRNLIDLDMNVYCHDVSESQCVFKLNDDDVVELTMALTQVESLLIGRACFEGTCSTTVACLLPISVHCVKLKNLEIHFNATNIVDDFKNTLDDPRLRRLRPLPRCPLTHLDVFEIPLSLDEHGFEIVLNGMTDIFPSLQSFGGVEPDWDELSRRLAGRLEG